MQKSIPDIIIQVNEHLYIKNPESSGLGKRIVSGSIKMINEMGYEQFTFRKLANTIKTTEASVYRYFESKYKLLLYLTSWYWSWMEFRLVFGVTNILTPINKLKMAITILTEEIKADNNFEHIDEVLLHQLVISESPKVYLNKEVDAENQYGVFKGYKQLVSRVCDIILEMNPNYKYPHMLVSTVIEGAHHQRYFAEHLPRLTDVINGEDAIVEFYKNMVINEVSHK